MATLKVYATVQHLHVKTYVHYGKLSVPVEFTGGKLTSNGITAATYSTSNETMQRFIESSTEFKNGVIFLQRTIVDGNIQRQKAKPKADASGTGVKPKADASGAGAERPEAKPQGTVADESIDTVQCFDRLADAKEWLNSLGANTDTIIKKAQAEQIAKGMGYVINWN